MGKWFVVDKQGLYIDSSWDGIPEATARATDFKKEGGQPTVMKVPRVGGLVLDPKDPASWKPKRQNPRRPLAPRHPPWQESVRNVVQDMRPRRMPKSRFADGPARSLYTRMTSAYLEHLFAKDSKAPVAVQKAAKKLHADCEAARPANAAALAVLEANLLKKNPRAAHDYEFYTGRDTDDDDDDDGIYLDADDMRSMSTFEAPARTPTQKQARRRAAAAESVRRLDRALRSNPPLEEHVEHEPQRTVSALQKRYGRQAVEHMLDEDDNVDEQAEKAAYMDRHEAGLRNNPHVEPGEAGEHIYAMWHQKEPKRLSRVKLQCNWEDELVRVGKAFSIVYRSGKWEKGNKSNDYIHHFDSKPSVYMLPGSTEHDGSAKSVQQLFGPLQNPDGQAEVAELATPLSFALDDGTSEGAEMKLHRGAKVYGGVDKKTVLIVDPVWGPIVIKGGKMYFDERGIVL
jgi:hypothetical protein